MKVLVCGGRDFTDHVRLHKFLDNFCLQRGLASERDEYGNWVPRDIEIISGAARGADLMATQWADVNSVPFKEYPANWKLHGKAAGRIRNQKMLDEGKPDVVIAFPGGRGTADMMRRAREAGVPVIEA